jgi:toxin ParE1/3/4
MLRIRLSAEAQADILHILEWTQDRHGDGVREQYEKLVLSALRDLLADPLRLGSVARPELGDEVRSYHLRNNRKEGRIARPRHLILYRMRTITVDVGRVLHDAMELERHLTFDFSYGPSAS